MNTVDAGPARSLFGDTELASRIPKPTRGTRIASWIATGLFAAMMTFSGILFVLGPEPIAEGIYPAPLGPVTMRASFALRWRIMAASACG